VLAGLQGAYEPQHKLAEQWRPLLDSARSGKLAGLLHAHAQQQVQQGGAGNLSALRFQGMLAPERAGSSYRIVIEVHFPLVRNSSAAARGLSGKVAGYEPAAAAAADWAAPLHDLHGEGVALRPEGTTLLAVSCEPGILQARRHHSA
jgi:hypothetical protein